MSKKISLNSYTPNGDDKIFIDANIWLYLFCPIGNYKHDIVNGYNKLFFKLLNSKCAIYTTSMILSEFFNVYCRIDFAYKKKEARNKNLDYKNDFRNTSYFQSLTENICDIINNKILKYSIRLNDEFNNIDIENILISDNNFDFNDKYHAQLCESNNIKILTNDHDFLNLSNNIEIITL